MKKIIPLLFLIQISAYLSAQYCGVAFPSGSTVCTPLDTFTSPGLYPTPDQLSPLINGQVSPIIMEFKNFDTVLFGTFTLTVDYVQISAVDNLPSGLCWASDTTNNLWPRQGTGCLALHGTPCDNPGQYRLRILANVSLNGGAIVLDTFDVSGIGLYYYIRLNNNGDAVTPIDTNGQTAGTNTFISYNESPICTNCSLGASVTSTGTVCGGSTGMAYATPTSGHGPFSYTWSNGSLTDTISGLGVGLYTVTITDSTACSATALANISSPATYTATGGQQNVLCYGSANGKAWVTTSGTTGNVTYQWSNAGTTDTISGLSPGTYIVTITDGSGCSKALAVTVTEPASPLHVTASSIAVSCFGGNDGAVAALVAGGTPSYTYTWTGGATGDIVAGLTAGTYTVTVTDANSCTATAQTVINQPAAALSATATSTNILCFGANTGTVAVTASGGTVSYNYDWSNGGTVDLLTNLTAGTYTVTISDANGCSVTAQATITQPTRLTVTNTAVNETCYGDSNASINVSAVGGTPTYSYMWTDGNTLAQQSQLQTGSYAITVTDANGCTATTQATISQPAPIMINISTTTATGNNGTATASVTGGSPPYGVLWSNGGTSLTDSLLASGSYTITITDAQGCTATANANVVAGITNINSEAFNMELFPNPANDLITVKLQSQNAAEVVLKITDAAGRTIYTRQESSTGLLNEKIEVRAFAPGIYSVQALSGSFVTVKSFVIAR